MTMDPVFGAVFLMPVAAWLLAWGTALVMVWMGNDPAQQALTLFDEARHHYSQMKEEQR